MPPPDPKYTSPGSAVHWGETYYPNESESEWVLEHTVCDHEFTPQPQMNCSECSEPVAPTDLRSYRREDGPGRPNPPTSSRAS